MGVSPAVGRSPRVGRWSRRFRAGAPLPRLDAATRTSEIARFTSLVTSDGVRFARACSRIPTSASGTRIKHALPNFEMTTMRTTVANSIPWVPDGIGAVSAVPLSRALQIGLGSDGSDGFRTRVQDGGSPRRFRTGVHDEGSHGGLVPRRTSGYRLGDGGRRRDGDVRTRLGRTGSSGFQRDGAP
jgi:hypothetical protein